MESSCNICLDLVFSSYDKSVRVTLSFERVNIFCIWKEFQHVILSINSSLLFNCKLRFKVFIGDNTKFLHYGNKSFKVKESRYIASSVVSGSIKKLSPIDCVNIYLFSIFFSIDFSNDCVNIYLFSIFFFNQFCPVEKCGVIQHCLV